MRVTTVSAIAVAVISSGCATITSGEVQRLSVNTATMDGRAVEQASCNLRNDKGSWDIVSPGFVDVRRSSDDLIVECRKEGVADGFLRAVSRVAGGIFGNIIFGGGIGAMIDHTRGAGYDYPSDLPVKMGHSTTVDKRDEKGGAGAQGENVSALNERRAGG